MTEASPREVVGQSVTVRSLAEARDLLGLVLQCGEEGLEREIRNRSAVKPAWC